jgi:hypothetical protein
MSLLAEQPARMAREQRLLAQLASESWFNAGSWTAAEGGLEFSCTLRAADKAYDAVLVYPDLFPDVPCYVRPRRAREHWSAHQYVSGVLCLQRGPDNWDRSVTGADMLRSAATLLGAERMRQLLPWAPKVPSRHTETPGQQLRFERYRLVLTQGFFDAVAAAGGPAVGACLPLEAGVSYLDLHSVMVPLAVGNPKQLVSDVPVDALRAEFFPRTGWVVSCAGAPADRELTSVQALRDVLGDKWPWPEGVADSMQALVLMGSRGELRAFCVRGGEQESVLEFKVVDCRKAGGQRQPAGFAELGASTVAILGLGSVGGKVAVTLCRAGVRRFLLVDDDVLGPENLVRNELTWRDVAFDKVESIKRQLELVAAGVKVEVFRTRLAGQENPQVEAELAVALSGTKLVVDATASAPAFLTAAALCRRSGVAMVWGELFAGGGGGLIARSRPGQEADPLSIRSHIFGVLQEFSPVPTVANPGRYAGDVDGEVMVASDADVSVLAAALSQFALDTLSSAAASEYPYAAYLLGFRKFWDFQQPFDIRPIDCSGAATHVEPVDVLTPEDEQALEQLRGQLGGRDAARDGST